MSLKYSGEALAAGGGRSRLAIDQNGERVIVYASDEVIEDHGWEEAWTKAEQKYALGRYDKKDDTRPVRVMTLDLL